MSHSLLCTLGNIWKDLFGDPKCLAVFALKEEKKKPDSVVYSRAFASAVKSARWETTSSLPQGKAVDKDRWRERERDGIKTGS